MKHLDTQKVIALSLLDGVGNKTIMRIGEVLSEQQVSIITARELYDFLCMAKERKLVKRLPTLSFEDVEMKCVNAQRIIDASAASGIGAVSFLDDQFPKTLLKTVDEKGNLSVPVVLYYKGDINIAAQPGIAVIGTREPTSEGERIGEYFASEFAKRGFNIVSGLAIGCDTCGHRGALKVGGKTTAFLAHGLTTIYPPQNEELAERIVQEGGLLMSEYSIGTPISPYFLVARDRLQSGLAKATLVIQTGINGGTMHASNATLVAQKPLFVVGYKDEFTQSHEKTEGNEYLAKKGAKCIYEDDDIDEIATFIKDMQPVKTSLFEF
jgi:DNA processing protein